MKWKIVLSYPILNEPKEAALKTDIYPRLGDKTYTTISKEDMLRDILSDLKCEKRSSHT